MSNARSFLASAALFALCGCVSVDRDAQRAVLGLKSGMDETAVTWSAELADESSYSKNLGKVEAGRTMLLTGKYAEARRRFSDAVDSAVDRTEAAPKLKAGDMLNTAMAATVTDDRTREYYLAAYEINLALQYGIFSRLLTGDREGALVDARLSVYVQDTHSETLGADLQKETEGSSESSKSIVEEQGKSLEALIAATRNSWENPLLWWLSGVMFEADGDKDMAWQSYRKAAAVKPDCAVFAADAARADKAQAMDAKKARLIVLYEQDFVPQRESVKVPVPIYTGMSIDIPRYGENIDRPRVVSVSCSKRETAASLATDVRSLAARDLKEQLPGVVVRNITRASVQAGAQAAANASGNSYVKLAVFVCNAIVSALRSADTRSWVTLPAFQHIWSDMDMQPGAHDVEVKVDGRIIRAKVTLAPGETRLLWIADTGNVVRGASFAVGEKGAPACDLNGKEISL